MTSPIRVVSLPTPSAAPPEPDWKRLIPDGTDNEGARVDNSGWRSAAHDHWQSVLSELRANDTLAPVNGHQIQRLVISYVRYDIAAARVMSQGPVGCARKTGTPIINMWQVELRQADSDATQAEMELCINPRRRAAAGKTKKRAGKGTAADSYLAAKG